MDNYNKILDAIPHWRPTREERVFGVSAIMRITGCGFKEAVRIRENLEYDGALPKDRW